MNKPPYKMCIDIPTQFCSPDVCGRFEMCKAVRLLKMTEMVSLIISTCEMIDMIDKLNDDEGEDWDNG